MVICRNGTTRIVVLIGRYAIKFPYFANGYKNGLWGLLGNLQEHSFWSTRDERLCPVLFCCYGGLFNIMQRAEHLTEDEWKNFDYDRYVLFDAGQNHKFFSLPVEFKPSSFGKIKGRIVAIDYGDRV